MKTHLAALLEMPVLGVKWLQENLLYVFSKYYPAETVTEVKRVVQKAEDTLK